MKTFVAILTGCLLWGTCEAQIGNFVDQLSSNQQLIKDAIEDGILIFRQNYQLQDTTSARPVFYGRQGRPQFGTIYSVGIMCKGGYYATGRLVQPWEYDANFGEYRNSAQYVPVISKTEYRGIKDSTYKVLIFRESIPDSGRVDRLFLVEDSLFIQGLSPAEQTCVDEGWIVLAVLPRLAEQDDSSQVTLQIYRNKLTPVAGKHVYEIKTPVMEQTVVGGVYLVPVVTSVGQITCYCGGLVEKIKDKWYIVMVDGVGTVLQEEENVLTPIVSGNEGTTISDESHRNKRNKRKNK